MKGDIRQDRLHPLSGEGRCINAKNPQPYIPNGYTAMYSELFGDRFWDRGDITVEAYIKYTHIANTGYSTFDGLQLYFGAIGTPFSVPYLYIVGTEVNRLGTGDDNRYTYSKLIGYNRKPVHIINSIKFDKYNGTMKVSLYLDGIFISEVIANTASYDSYLPPYKNSGIFIGSRKEASGWNYTNFNEINHIRIFNYALSDTECKMLYNNGRPDKFRLPDYMKGLQDLSKWTIHSSTPYTISQSDGTSVNQTFNKAFVDSNGFNIDYTDDAKSFPQFLLNEPQPKIYQNKNYKCTIVGKIDSGSVTWTSAGNVLSNSANNFLGSLLFSQSNGVEVSVIQQGQFAFNLPSSNTTLITIKRGAIAPCKGYIKSIELQQIGCIAEYLPSSLTPTMWYDTSGQGKHLTATGTAEIVYETPYQEVILSDVAPNVIPDFITQKWIMNDGTTKRLYEAKGTASVSDWILKS